MTQIEQLEQIIQQHIDCIQSKEEITLNDTKQLVEVLKSILTLTQIKNSQPSISKFDKLSEDELLKDFE
jgi:hypothetical protein